MLLPNVAPSSDLDPGRIAGSVDYFHSSAEDVPDAVVGIGVDTAAGTDPKADNMAVAVAGKMGSMAVQPQDVADTAGKVAVRDVEVVQAEVDSQNGQASLAVWAADAVFFVALSV